jgi:hypothetical protein
MDLVMVAWRSSGQGTANDDQFLAMYVQGNQAVGQMINRLPTAELGSVSVSLAAAGV